MRVIRIRYRGTVFFAALQNNGAVCLNRQLGIDAPIPFEEFSLLPVVAPSKIICVGLNYKGHAAELDFPVPVEPVFFLKAPSSIIGNGQPIILPEATGRIDHEGELAIVMGRQCRNILPEQARENIFGFTCANDVTARDIQKRDGMFGRCKGFDTFCPIGPWIEAEIDDPGDLTIRTYVNDDLRQSGSTSDMLFHPFELISSISRVMTLLPGDVILTGTPEGIGPLRDGDSVRVEIDRVGTLSNPVLAENGTDTADAPLQ